MEVVEELVAVPSGATHLRLVIDKASGKVVHCFGYGEGELKEIFLKTGVALGLDKIEPPSAAPVPAAQ